MWVCPWVCFMPLVEVKVGEGQEALDMTDMPEEGTGEGGALVRLRPGLRTGAREEGGRGERAPLLSPPPPRAPAAGAAAVVLVGVVPVPFSALYLASLYCKV